MVPGITLCFRSFGIWHNCGDDFYLKFGSLGDEVTLNIMFQGGTSVVVPYCYLFLLSVFILWFSYYVSDIFCEF